MQSYQKLVVAVDLSDSATQVLERARLLAQTDRAALHIIHVLEFSPPDYDEWAGPIDLGLEAEVRARVEERLKERCEALGIGHLDRQVLTGVAKTEIVAFARDTGCDLIVIGSHGRRGLAALLGSTADYVLHHAPCDVLAVRIG